MIVADYTVQGCLKKAKQNKLTIQTAQVFPNAITQIYLSLHTYILCSCMEPPL